MPLESATGSAGGARPRVLFVDDEQELLDGLRLVLHRKRRVWDVRFALGGEEALRCLAAESFSVVVTDIRMPGMDGATLLAEVQRRHPAVARLVLSGQCDELTARRAARAAHRWLAKPCEPTMLTAAIERAITAQGMLAEGALVASVSALSRLPSPERAALELAACLSDPNVDTSMVAEVVAGDPAMAARLLQLANSAFFGPSCEIHDIREAVMRLGLTTLAQLVVEQEFVGRLASDVPGFSVESNQRRARAVARTTEALLAGQPGARTGALAGLLAGVGRLALACIAPQEYGALLREAARGEQRLADLERATFGVGHEVIGAALLAMWGLPQSVTEAVLLHVAPAQAHALGLDAVVATHVAVALVDGALGGHEGPALDVALLTSLGLTPHLERWRVMATEELAVQRRGAA